MIISFFESIKYAGHLWPISLMRIFTGVFFLNAGLDKIHKNFLQSPVLQDVLNKWIESGGANPHYVNFIQQWVLPHWRLFSHLVVAGEIGVGISFLIGFMVRPACLVAIFLLSNFMSAGAQPVSFMRYLIAIIVTFFLVQAGRCLGFDYYFYKRVRGVWW